MISDNLDFERAVVREGSAPPPLTRARRIFPGVLAAAASAGVIIGDGWNDGTTWVPFIRLGSAILPPRFDAMVPTGVQAVMGLALHTLLLTVWGYCFTAVAHSLRGGKLFIAALILTGALWVLARVIFPLALGAAELSLMSPAHAALYLITVALALSIGTRLARYA